MARHRHLGKAPAKEALIDIQFEPSVSLSAIDGFVSSIQDTFGNKSDLWTTTIGLSAHEGGQGAHYTQNAIGRRLESLKEPYVLQCRVSGFTLSRLSPYGEWNDLRTQARRLWEVFHGQVGEIVVTRIAVRYINELKLPLPMSDFSEYLTCPPKIPDALPQAISGFLTRVIIPDESTQCVSVVTQVMDGPPFEGATGASITVILDIDVFRTTRLASSQMAELWTGLDVLRDQKNKIFFEHLTEKAVEIYE